MCDSDVVCGALRKSSNQVLTGTLTYHIQTSECGRQLHQKNRDHNTEKITTLAASTQPCMRTSAHGTVLVPVFWRSSHTKQITCFFGTVSGLDPPCAHPFSDPEIEASPSVLRI